MQLSKLWYKSLYKSAWNFDFVSSTHRTIAFSNIICWRNNQECTNRTSDKYLPEISERTDRKIQNFIFGRKSSLISDRSWFWFLDASWWFIYILTVYIPFTLSANSVKTDLKKMDRQKCQIENPKLSIFGTKIVCIGLFGSGPENCLKNVQVYV